MGHLYQITINDVFMFNFRKEFCVDKMASFPAIAIVLPEYYVSQNGGTVALLRFIVPEMFLWLRSAFFH